jgi:trimeric autotransporter adhesin
MRRAVLWWTLMLGMVVSCGFTGRAQALASTQSSPQNPVTGGRLHGVVKSGNHPAARRDRDRAEHAHRQALLDHNGHYRRVVAEHSAKWALRDSHAVCGLCGRVAGSGAERHEPRPDGELRADAGLAGGGSNSSNRQDAARAQQAPRRRPSGNLAANGAQSLSLMSALAADTETQAGTAGASGAALPSIAGNSDFGGDSVAISGQSGQVSPLAGVDMDRIRDAIETSARRGHCQGAGAELWRCFGGGGGFGGGGFGGGFGGGVWRWGFGGGGGRGNFRGFNPGQPHGAIFWIGSNSALNAEPFRCAASRRSSRPRAATASASPS